VQRQELGVITRDRNCVIHTRGAGFKNVEWPSRFEHKISS
jgi:hypothetical protein